MAQRLKVHVKRNDFVQVLSGKDKGKRGKVVRVFPQKQRVLVEGVNFVHKHLRPTPKNQQGGIVKMEAPINASNVMLVCIQCDKPSRVNKKVLEGGLKVRQCKRCGEILDKA